MIIKSQNIAPKIHDTVWVAPNVTIVGDVEIGENVTVWYQAVIRGDVGKIIIGKDSNIQDGVLIHSTYQKTSVTIGERVSVAHHVILHGAVIQDDVLLGMGSIIMDNVNIPSFVIIGAGSLVKASDKLESCNIYAGNPLRHIRKIDGNWKEMIQNTAKNYKMYASWQK